MTQPHSRIFSVIGNTPLVQITHRHDNPKVRILAKLEGSNPGGSVKDRTAHYLIRDAEAAGLLTHDKQILEPTSGNTGIAIAMIGAAKGYKVTLTMPECVSLERRRVLEALGATVILSPSRDGTDGAIRMARRIYAEQSETYYMPDQFTNESNCLAHYETTGPEIFAQTEGAVDVFVAGMGTTGTLMGTGRYLREKKPGVKIIGIEPPVGHAIQGLKNMKEAIVPPIYHPEELNDIITVNDDEAYDMARALARHEGLFVGMSSGAAVAGAIKIAQGMREGTIVTILPDRGDRYLSTNLFRSVCACCPP